MSRLRDALRGTSVGPSLHCFFIFSMAFSDVPRKLRERLFVGAGLIVLGTLAFALHAPPFLLMLSALALLCGIGTLTIAYYEGTTLILLSPRYAGQAWLPALVVAIPWSLMAGFFAQDASIARLHLNGKDALWYASIAAVIAVLSNLLGRDSVPRARAFLMGFAIIGCICAMTRGNIHLSSGDEDYEPPEDTRTPEQHRDVALFNFFLYSGACAVGVYLIADRPSLAK